VPANSPPRSFILVNANIDPSHVKQIPIPSDFITAIAISAAPAPDPLCIVNVYNPPNTDSAITDLEAWYHTSLHCRNTIWASDFNKHHPLWSGHSVPERCQRSDCERLLQLLLCYDLSLRLPAGTLTYQSDCHETWSTLDLVFCTQDALRKITTCSASPCSRLPGADHLPIHSTINTTVPTIPPVVRYNFKDTDWAKFRAELQRQLDDRHLTTHPLTTHQDLDNFINDLTTTIQLTTAAHVPKACPSPYAKRWWTPQLAELWHTYARASHAEFAARGTPGWHAAKTACKSARNIYTATLRRTKVQHWRTWLEDITEADIWHAGHYAAGDIRDSSMQTIPTLHAASHADPSVTQVYDTADKKSELLTMCRCT